MEDIRAVCHARTMFYPGDAQQFLEAVLNIPEKLRSLARKAVGGTSAHGAATVVGQRRNRFWCLARRQILMKREIS
jgi:hypothetical protein